MDDILTLLSGFFFGLMYETQIVLLIAHMLR